MQVWTVTEFYCDRPNTKYNNLRDGKYESKQRLLTWLVHVNDFSSKFRHNEYSIKLQWSWLVNYQHLPFSDLTITTYNTLIIPAVVLREAVLANKNLRKWSISDMDYYNLLYCTPVIVPQQV